MCTGNFPDPLGLFKGKNALPDPLHVHTPTPAEQALEAAKKAAEERAAAMQSQPEDESPKEALKIKRPASKPRSRLGRMSLRIDLQSPGGGDAGGPPTLGTS
jgi:hypothetical protein